MSAMDTRKRIDPAAPSADPWISAPEAARIVGVAKATIFAMATRGELAYQVVGGRTFIDRASAEAAGEARREAARAAS